jgi:flavin-dependent dehydrogenase
VEYRKKAVVIGGGIAGKLAARVLSEYFQEVIILERDQKPEGPHPRKGAPQGKHLHALLFAGDYGLEELFPGISKQFHANFAVKINSTKELAWFHHGVWKLRYDGPYSTTLQTRPHLEWQIEQEIHKIANLTVRYNTVVQNYLFNKQENRIIGVELQGEKMDADLVVDTSGASSFSTNWLTKQNIHIPEEKVKINLTYASQFFELPESEERDWAIKIVYPNPPLEKSGGTISKVEGNRYVVTINRYHSDEQINDIMRLAKQLPKPDIYNEIKDAAPLSETAIYRVPQIVWRRFEKMKNLPEGLLLIGDTVCRIDPVFGQGMSIAVLEALALKKYLKDTKTISSARFQKRVAKMISPIWGMVLAEDFRYPETTGNKPYGLKLQQWYAKEIFLLSAEDSRIYDRFVKVMNLIGPMTILMHPKVVFRVLKKVFLN